MGNRLDREPKTQRVIQKREPSNGYCINQEIRKIALERKGVIYLDPKRASEYDWTKMGVL